MTSLEIATALRDKLVAAHHAKGSALSAAEWLAVAEKCLSECQPTRQMRKATSFSMGAGQSDDDWLAEIGAHPALVGVNVRQEVESCRLWSSSRGVKPSRRRIVNWLLKAVADRPLRVQQGQFAGGAAPTRPQTEMEPMGWRQEFSDSMWAATPWPEVSASSREFIVQRMAELAQKQA